MCAWFGIFQNIAVIVLLERRSSKDAYAGYSKHKRKVVPWKLRAVAIVGSMTVIGSIYASLNALEDKTNSLSYIVRDKN